MLVLHEHINSHTGPTVYARPIQNEVVMCLLQGCELTIYIACTF